MHFGLKIQIKVKSNWSPRYFIQGHTGKQRKGGTQTKSICKFQNLALDHSEIFRFRIYFRSRIYFLQTLSYLCNNEILIKNYKLQKKLSNIFGQTPLHTIYSVALFNILEVKVNGVSGSTLMKHLAKKWLV